MRQTDYATDRLYDRLTMRQNDYANPRRKPFPDRILDICYLFACQLLGHQCVYLLTARAPMPVHHQRKHIFFFLQWSDRQATILTAIQIRRRLLTNDYASLCSHCLPDLRLGFESHSDILKIHVICATPYLGLDPCADRVFDKLPPLPTNSVDQHRSVDAIYISTTALEWPDGYTTFAAIQNRIRS
jgi:hypothetical protein